MARGVGAGGPVPKPALHGIWGPLVGPARPMSAKFEVSISLQRRRRIVSLQARSTVHLVRDQGCIDAEGQQVRCVYVNDRLVDVPM